MPAAAATGNSAGWTRARRIRVPTRAGDGPENSAHAAPPACRASWQHHRATVAGRGGIGRAQIDRRRARQAGQGAARKRDPRDPLGQRHHRRGGRPGAGPPFRKTFPGLRLITATEYQTGPFVPAAQDTPSLDMRMNRPTVQQVGDIVGPAMQRLRARRSQPTPTMPICRPQLRAEPSQPLKRLRVRKTWPRRETMTPG